MEREKTAERRGSLSRRGSGVSDFEIGAVDEESFQRQFPLGCPSVVLTTERDFTTQLTAVQLCLGSRDWRRRITGLSLLRALSLAAPSLHPELAVGLYPLTQPLASCLAELRSQVVKETCLTLACLAQELSHLVEKILLPLLSPLLSLLTAAPRVASSSGLIALRFLLHNCPFPG